MRYASLFWFTCLSTIVLLLSGCNQAKPEDFAKTLQERLISAKTGDVIDIPEGT